MEKPNFETHGTQYIPLSLPKPMRYSMKIPTANAIIIKQTIKNALTVILKTLITNIEIFKIFIKN